jgi:solute carrier family 25 phosphate transporter 3
VPIANSPRDYKTKKIHTAGKTNENEKMSSVTNVIKKQEKSVLAAAAEPTQKGGIELYTPAFYALCSVGGILSCGITHTLVTPVDLVKCRLQTGFKYNGTLDGVSQIYREGGVRGLFRGWGPTAVGYSAQGLCKFGFYELFKKEFFDVLANNFGEETAYKNKTLVYVTASASAEVIADIALCPWEAIKVRVQTDPTFARGLSDGLPKLYGASGLGGLYKGLVPLWSRQVPYTIMKFTAFERVVEAIYKYALSKPKAEYNKAQQLGVTFVAGYIAGVFCAVVSHPADVVVSKLNKNPDKSAGDIIKDLGFKGCWTGLGPRIFMVGTLTALQWFIYDSFKVAIGLPTAGAAPPAPKQN